MKNKYLYLINLLFLLTFRSFIFANESPSQLPILQINTESLPEIPDLYYKDFLYKQYSEDLQQYYIDFAAQNPTYVAFYSYTVKEDDTLFTLAARCNIPYDTIATINSIETADTKLTGKKIILPTCSGLFIPANNERTIEKTKTTIEALLQKKFINKLNDSAYFCYNINGRFYTHITEDKFDQTIRAFFLDVKMKPPLDKYWLSSDYGYRKNPFGGEQQFHKGIDMAAPEGTPVYACKAGKVISATKLDATFGNYIVIKHSNGLSSIYAHLSKMIVKMGEAVSTGQKIGEVGKTGKVTGAHLHFEIRQNGQATNPNAYIKW